MEDNLQKTLPYVFHGITAVAELKRASRPDILFDIVVFHGITAVAELKPRSIRGGVIDPLRVFHGITAVAELKLRETLNQKNPSGCFPRHHRRGRIEATYRETYSWLVLVFSTASPPWPN